MKKRLSKSDKISIRKLERKGYKVLQGKELEKELKRMEDAGCMRRYIIPDTPSGRKRAAELYGTFSVFKKV